MRLQYKNLPNFKVLLFGLGLVIVLGVILYTNSIVDDLRISSRQYLTLQVERFRLLFMQDDANALEAYLQEMASKDFPVIFSDSTGMPISWSGLPELDGLTKEEAMVKATEFQWEWLSHGNNPVTFEMSEFGLTYYFYYGDSGNIRRLRLLPWVEVLLVGGLIWIGYFGFSSIKKSEERSVWVGMAKEVAHQLGTPLTSLMGWVELLESHAENPDVIKEMKHDLKRLTSVADRFNKIGSKPSLKNISLHAVVDEAAVYIRRRLPSMGSQEVTITIDIPENLVVSVNKTLFGWVLENLFKNAVEAFNGEAGTITVEAQLKGKKVLLDFADDGHGIKRRNWQDIFRPGYTTKKRGWGLGLSLSRRIVEMHNGSIWIHESYPDDGTVIRMQLPVS